MHIVHFISSNDRCYLDTLLLTTINCSRLLVSALLWASIPLFATTSQSCRLMKLAFSAPTSLASFRMSSTSMQSFMRIFRLL